MWNYLPQKSGVTTENRCSYLRILSELGIYELRVALRCRSLVTHSLVPSTAPPNCLWSVRNGIFKITLNCTGTGTVDDKSGNVENWYKGSSNMCIFKTKYLPTWNYCRDTVRTTKRKHGMAFGLTDKSRRVEWGELRTEKEAFSAVGTLPPHLIIAKAAG